MSNLTHRRFVAVHESELRQRQKFVASYSRLKKAFRVPPRRDGIDQVHVNQAMRGHGPLAPAGPITRAKFEAALVR